MSLKIRAEKLSKFWVLAVLVASCEAFATGVADPKGPARVVHSNTNKIGFYAVFNQGANTGFVIGREICVYSVDRSKVLCSTIVRSKPTASAIQLTAEDKERIKKGYFGWPQDLGEPVISDDDLNRNVGKISRDAKELSQQEDDPPEPVLPPMLQNRWDVHLSPTYALPIWMNDLRFNAGARASGKGKIWESGDTIKGSAIGMGARIHQALAGRGDSAFDLTYHFVPQKPVRDDFDLTDGSVYVQSEVWSHQLRFRWLRGATWKHTDDSDLLMYTGFGYDFLYAKFKSSKVGSSNDELVSGRTLAHGFEIPVVMEYESTYGAWRWSVGMDLALPLGVYGKKMTAKLSYADDTADADKSLGAVEKALNIRRGWFSAALHCGIGRSL
jgi:hypothetical protein